MVAGIHAINGALKSLGVRNFRMPATAARVWKTVHGRGRVQVEHRLIELHIVEARKRALRLFAFGGAVYPEVWGSPYIEDISISLLEFGFHARRVNDLCDFGDRKFSDVDKFIVNFSVPPKYSIVKKYQFALNRLIHAKRFIFQNVHADHRNVFSEHDNLVPVAVAIETDQRSCEAVSIIGVSNCFLHEVIPLVKSEIHNINF